jgi:beta-lactamase superfamily II metal-dependent hydrolase
VLFTLEPLPASEGDCLLLHWGTKAAPHLALIDGGPAGTYTRTLQKRLAQYLQRSGEERLTLELVMVSHVDNDHISGVRDLFAEMAAGDSDFGAKRLWHNTFDDIVGGKIDAYYQTLTATYTASVGGQANPTIEAAVQKAARERDPKLTKDEAHEIGHDVALLLAGHGEARQLRDDFKVLFDGTQIAALNDPFTRNNKPTLVEARAEPVKIQNLSLQVVGPLRPEVEALQAAFDKYIKDKGLTAEAVLAAYADKSVPNLSSICCIAAFGSGAKRRTILLTGDARGDKLIQGLEKAGVRNGTEPIEVDVLKVPHHGSDNNVAKAFFKTIIASHYVFSGDGKYGNPDVQTLRWLVEARGKAAVYDIYLTYSVAHIDDVRETYYSQHNMTWSAETHSLAPFLAQCRAEGYKFRLHAKAPIQIDLGDESAPW